MDYPFSVRGGRREQERVKANVLAPYVVDGKYFKCVIRYERTRAKTFEFETATTDSRMRIRRVMRRVVDRDGRRGMFVIECRRARALRGFRDVDGWR